MAEANSITVLLVDDHDVVRKGLRFYLNARPEVTIVGEAGDTQTAVAEAARLVPTRSTRSTFGRSCTELGAVTAASSP